MFSRAEFRDWQPRPCHTCGGSGRARSELHGGALQPCWTCKGSGRLYLDVGAWGWGRGAKGKLELPATPCEQPG